MATTISNNPEASVLELAKMELQRQLRQEIFDDLLNAEILRFREAIEPDLRSRVEKITLDGIESYMDVCRMNQEIRVSIRTDGKEPTVTRLPRSEKSA